MAIKPHIVVLATAWGPKHGGINAFNIDLCKSLGLVQGRDFELLCVVLQTNADEQADAKRCHVDLYAIDQAGSDLDADCAGQVWACLPDAITGGEGSQIIWVGHDDKTGPLALALRTAHPGSKAALINHMAPGAYQSFKKGNNLDAKAKKDQQRAMFSQADLCFAVGPLLTDHLQDLLATVPAAPKVVTLIPGLADLHALGVKALDVAPHNFTTFVAGRLAQTDDRIKQGRLAVAAFGQALRASGSNGALNQSPTLRMRGVQSNEQDGIKQLFAKHAEREINFDLDDYTEDRQAYFTDMASSSVAMMPSWHEGFGLVAWEAIASAVPVVLGQQSGVYR
jgi:glycosyltransferase involved in cell wall biosynthesis